MASFILTIDNSSNDKHFGNESQPHEGLLSISSDLEIVPIFKLPGNFDWSVAMMC